MLERCLTSDYDDLMAYVERINRLNRVTACSLFVIHQDRIVAEYYSGEHAGRPTSAQSQFNVASVRKSYMGFAAAWALTSGAISSFDDLVVRYVTPISENAEALDGITIRHLLTHTHGLKREAGQLVRRFEPGTAWDYNNEGIPILANVIEQATGRTIAELVDELVLRPLEMRETGWRTARTDQLVPVVEEGGLTWPLDSNADGSEGNLFVSARELAYWGYLHLKLGRVNGRSIVPETVIRHAISIQSPSRLSTAYPRNGCLWLVKNALADQCLIGRGVPDQSYGIVGIYGPLVLVVPELELVVVRMANRLGNYEDEQGSYIDYLREFGDKAVQVERHKSTI
ncbi:serine hydrolase domain-containing protein [Paenibacillus xylaniclasticus]|uniref:serine hydrolase domain-containing protein n=1 Tax=Paenibacillus xylaniclasticus TaxID=588083 RepID=UPI000FDC5843|nr:MULTISPECIES: serine hydrolase domain-containing protein [Paenibacillus]GFN33528.1 penicillin-binding protein [Paenibacillus curdlanolyticus]